MSRKRTGIETLTNMMVKQHGVEKTYWIARDAIKTLTDPRRVSIWRQVAVALADKR